LPLRNVYLKGSEGQASRGFELRLHESGSR
jgi:hypothetical protein